MKSVLVLAAAGLISVASAVPLQADSLDVRTPRENTPKVSRDHRVLFPLRSIVRDDGTHTVTMVVRINGSEVFRESYQIGNDHRSNILALHLEGARDRDLLAAEEYQPGAVKVDVLLDGRFVRTMTVPQLLQASRDTELLPDAVVLDLRPETSYHSEEPLHITMPDVRNPGTQKVSSQVKTVKRGDSRRFTLRPHSNFVCPSASSGVCAEDFENCAYRCDPRGDYQECMEPCHAEYDWCYFGNRTQTEQEWFTPQSYQSSSPKFYPWYEWWDVYYWDLWNGMKHRRVTETINCKYDGDFGPFVVIDESYADTCWIETPIRQWAGAYLDDCKFGDY